MKKKLWPLASVLITAILTACTPDYEENFHFIARADAGNELLLTDGVRVRLLGVADTPANAATLRSYANQRVRLAFDPSQPVADPEAGAMLAAYVLTEQGASLNRQLLQGHPEALAAEAVPYDSLTAFAAAATGQPLAARTSAPMATASPIETPNTSEAYVVPAEVPANLSDLADEVDPAVLLIETDEGSQGTGFFVGSGGLAASNHHVFAGASAGHVTLADGRQLPITQIVEDQPARDYVLFRVGGALGRYAYLQPAAATPRRASPVYVIGNPKGLARTFTTGVVSALRTIDQPGDLIQFDAAISPGSSGSPVLNTVGEVVGIATFKRTECENCNFAVNIRALNLSRFTE